MKHDDQVLSLWDEWINEIGGESGDAGAFTEWGLANGKLVPRPQDIRAIVRKQVTQALRNAKRYDEEGGFTYRAKQSVTLFEGEEPIKHFFDTDNGGTPTIRQKSVKQRREAIAHDVYRAVCDTERMRKVHNEPQLRLFTDFTDDVAELRAADTRHYGAVTPKGLEPLNFSLTRSQLRMVIHSVRVCSRGSNSHLRTGPCLRWRMRVRALYGQAAIDSKSQGRGRARSRSA